ncbi:unnamed protein product [Discosporangium mesarthrocarpum]
MKFSTAVVALACVGSTNAFMMPTMGRTRYGTTVMTAEKAPASRGEFLKSAVSASAVFGLAAPVLAEVDNPVVPYLGGSEKIDVNNANVRAYIRLTGMYPNAAGKIVSNGPYSSVSEIYNIKGLSDKEKAAIKKWESRFVALEPQAMYTIDRINNGLYR